MIRIDIKPHTSDSADETLSVEGTYDIYVRDGNNGNLLVFSNQGYENVSFVQRLVKRLWASKHVWSETVGVEPDFETQEPIICVTHYLDGKTQTEQIR